MGGGEGASQATFDECAGGNSRDGGGRGGWHLAMVIMGLVLSVRSHAC